jgi:hypothetical protein
MWHDADTEARDLKSNALIARDVWRDCGGVRNGTDEIFTIRLRTRRVNIT